MAPISESSMRRDILFAMGALFGSSLFARALPATNGMKEADHLRNVRYCEVFLVTRHGLSGTAAVYNTLGLNDCPEQQWRALNVDALRKETGAYRVMLNGPRYFIMDKNALRNPGPERDFDGLKTHLVAELQAVRANEKRAPYLEKTVERQSCYFYEAGKNVYQLHSSAARSYIMQSYSAEVDPHQDEAALANLASRLSLPKGWHYEVRKLAADLTVCNIGDKARVLQDNFNNTYQGLDP